MAKGWIDYWSNDFRPEKSRLWQQAISSQDIPLKVRGEKDDRAAQAPALLARMNELGMQAIVLPSAPIPELAPANAYERFATPPEEVVRLAQAHPGRFAGLATIDPTLGQAGVENAGELLTKSGFVGLHLHTHSWDRPFDDRDYYPYYALAAEHDVPVIMQAGTSGGLMASECGQPIGIDRPALYFPKLRFVLSHTGWPWVDEAIAMAGKHANVFLGTAAYPPHHWSASLVDFIRRAGRGKVLLGTSFPVVGHRQALGRLEGLGLGEEAHTELLSGAARRVFRHWPGLPTPGSQEENSE